MPAPSNPFSIQIRITQEPLAAQNLATTMATLIELYTKLFLMQQGRFEDFIEYDQTKSPHFEEEANLLIAKITYNSPIEIKFNVDLSPKSVVEAFKMALDTILQRKHRLRAIELDNMDKELDIQKKKLEIKEYTFNIASEIVDKLAQGADTTQKAVLIKGLVPTLLQVNNNEGLEIILSPTQDEP